MTIRFSKGKLVEVQEKKVKMGLKCGLLTRKRQRENEPNKEDPMATSPVVTSMPHRPTSPTFSLELITHSLTHSDRGSKAKGRDKASISSFWEDAGTVILKAHEAISVNDLQPLGVKLSHELMSSHVHWVLQVRVRNCVCVRIFSWFFF